MAPPGSERLDELSFGHDPDLIARYLAGERALPQPGEARAAGSAPAADLSTQHPIWALVALALALALFAFSIWTALR